MFFLVLQLSFLELTTQFAAFLLLCSYCSCFLLGKLGVGLSIICNGSESRPPFCIACNSAICAASFTSDITLPCCSGSRSQACSLETHCSCTASCISPTFRVCQGQPARCPEEKHLSVRKAQSELGLSTQHLQVETFLSSLFTQAH